MIMKAITVYGKKIDLFPQISIYDFSPKLTKPDAAPKTPKMPEIPTLEVIYGRVPR